MEVRARHRQLTMLLLIAVAARLGAAAAAPSEFENDHVVQGCNSTCGNLKIPYPFGIGRSSVSDKTCFLDESFNLTCNNSTLYTSNVPVLNISSEEGQLELSVFVSQVCYNLAGEKLDCHPPSLQTAAYTISSKKNKFISVGCDTYGYLNTFRNGTKFSTGCVTWCEESPEFMVDLSHGNCSGIGCCQVDIPLAMKNITIQAGSFFNFNYTREFNRCSYSFVAKVGSYNFSTTELPHKEYPLVVDWVVGKETCEVANRSITYVCKKNSDCEDTESRNGYRCKCKHGYDGNPYLKGCEDVNECMGSNDCVDGACHNLIGSYNCSCPEGYEGDGKHNGSGCRRKFSSNSKKYIIWIISLSISVGLLVLVILVASICWVHKQRTLKQLREQFFVKNGGPLLQERLSQLQGNERTKIFTEAELEKATNNFHKSRILGRGGQGDVYKGILPNNIPVAIKKSRIGGDIRQVRDFINEVAVLSKINHKNVVKLLGCCLEAEIPYLVYEFVSNGTLLDHIDPTKNEPSVPWDTRLRIAADTADAVSYLHSDASDPIIHRDIKSTNILLDENYRAKVSDFGASRLVSTLDQDQVTTFIRGTWGYLDPEYLQTGELSEKSDVYSFGIVLVELLTGKKAVESSKPEPKSLAMHFRTSIREGRLMEILDRRVLNQNNVEQFKEVALLARRCIRVNGAERPSMKEVAIELEGLIAVEKHAWVKGDVTSEEDERLLGPGADAYRSAVTSPSAGYDSMGFEIEDGR